MLIKVDVAKNTWERRDNKVDRERERSVSTREPAMLEGEGYIMEEI